MTTPVPIALGSNPGRSSFVSDEKVVNGFFERAFDNAKQPNVIYGIHGLTRFADPSGASCRGMIEVDGAVYSLHSSLVFKTDSTGGTANIGFVPGQDRVIMARNAASPVQIVIVCAAGVYVIEDDAVTKLSDPILLSGVTSAAWVAQYFLFFKEDGTFYWSGLNATTVGALDFATAEGSPDGLVAGTVYRQEVFLFGQDSIEVWRVSPNAVPFERLSGAVIPAGCGSKHSIAQLDTVYWLDNKGIVRRLGAGYQPERVSNVGVETAILSVENPREISAFAYEYNGHSFYVLNHRTFTWVFDAATGLWHERQSYALQRSQATTYCFAFNKHLFGSTQGGAIYEADDNVFDEDGSPLKLLVRTPPIHGFPSGAIVHRTDLDVETGVGRNTEGDATSPAFDPEVMIRWSDDGSKTWTEGRRSELGKKGQYRRRVFATRCGRIGRAGRVYEFSISAPVFKALIGASIEAIPARG